MKHDILHLIWIVALFVMVVTVIFLTAAGVIE